VSGSKVCALIALVIFVLAAFGAWPNVLADAEPIALGLAFIAASMVLP